MNTTCDQDAAGWGYKASLAASAWRGVLCCFLLPLNEPRTQPGACRQALPMRVCCHRRCSCCHGFSIGR